MARRLVCLMGVAALACARAEGPADEMEAVWIAQDGPIPTNMSHAAWRAEKLARRAERLKPVAAMSKTWAYCRHYVLGRRSTFLHLSELSDAFEQRSYRAIGSSLCLAEYQPDGLWKETTLLSSKTGCYRDFGLVWTDVNGAREVLVAQDGKISCGRPVPVRARKLPARSSVRPDESLKTGTITIADVYRGESMKGVVRGTIKSMRVEDGCLLVKDAGAVGRSASIHVAGETKLGFFGENLAAAHAALAGKVTWVPGSALLIDTRNGPVRISGRDLLRASVVEKTGANDLIFTSPPVGVGEIRVRQGKLRTSEPDLIPPAVKVLSLGGQFLNNGG